MRGEKEREKEKTLFGGGFSKRKKLLPLTLNSTKYIRINEYPCWLHSFLVSREKRGREFSGKCTDTMVRNRTHTRGTRPNSCRRGTNEKMSSSTSSGNRSSGGAAGAVLVLLGDDCCFIVFL